MPEKREENGAAGQPWIAGGIPTCAFRRHFSGVLIAIAVFAAVAPLWAHHSYSAAFDISRRVTLSGTLAKVAWINPHTAFYLNVKTGRGKVEAWLIEGKPPGFFRKLNVSKNQFDSAVGRTVTVEVYRAKDGTFFASLLSITFPNGKLLSIYPTP